MLIQFIFAAILVFMFGAIAWQMVSDWRSTPKEDRDEFGEIVALGRGSITKAWLRVVGLVGAGLSAAANLAEALQLPQVTEAINTYLPAQYVTAALLAIALIGIWSRNHSLPSEDKTVF